MNSSTKVKLILVVIGLAALMVNMTDFDRGVPEKSDEQNKAELAARCHDAPNPDRMNYCRALALDDAKACEPIKENDLRHWCVAQVTEDAAPCKLIEDAVRRDECLAMTGG